MVLPLYIPLHRISFYAGNSCLLLRKCEQMGRLIAPSMDQASQPHDYDYNLAWSIKEIFGGCVRASQALLPASRQGPLNPAQRLRP